MKNYLILLLIIQMLCCCKHTDGNSDATFVDSVEIQENEPEVMYSKSPGHTR